MRTVPEAANMQLLGPQGSPIRRLCQWSLNLFAAEAIPLPGPSPRMISVTGTEVLLLTQHACDRTLLEPAPLALTTSENNISSVLSAGNARSSMKDAFD